MIERWIPAPCPVHIPPHCAALVAAPQRRRYRRRLPPHGTATHLHRLVTGTPRVRAAVYVYLVPSHHLTPFLPLLDPSPTLRSTTRRLRIAGLPGLLLCWMPDVTYNTTVATHPPFVDALPDLAFLPSLERSTAHVTDLHPVNTHYFCQYVTLPVCNYLFRDGTTDADEGD